jgi:hypothetical protein
MLCGSRSFAPEPNLTRSAAGWGPGEFTCPEAVTVEFHARVEQTELVLTHTEFPASHGPVPYQMGWEGGLGKFENLFTGSGVDG